LAVPIETPGGIVGVLSFYHQDRDAFTEQDRDLAIALGSKLAGVMERSREIVAIRTAPVETIAVKGGRG